MDLISFFSSYEKDVDVDNLISTLNSFKYDLDIKLINFDVMDKWNIDDVDNICHESGKFFSIKGACSFNKKTNVYNYQPIIDQPEQGILGLISRIKDSRIEILAQAKIEPGNVGVVQYSPTVQATRSNYSGVHNGRRVLYIENFIEESEEKEKVIFCDEVVSRGFQSEHGYKFYKKANDNVHVRADVEIVDDKFVWLCLSDIRFLFSKEHHLNMDMRSVLSTIDFVGYSLPISEVLDNIKSNISDLEKDLLVSSLSEENSLNSINEISEWLHEAKRYKKIDQEIIPLKSLYKHGWVLSDSSLKSNSNKNFEVVGIKATVDSREVCSWFQPIIKDNIPKVYAFLIKKINGIFHVLTKLVEEDYSWAGPELGPTLSSVDSNNLDLKKELLNFNVKENEYNVIYDRVQSEEGGRFLEQKNRYVLIVVNDDVDVIINQNYKWVTLYQLKRMTNSECCVNIEARSLLCIGSYFRE